MDRKVESSFVLRTRVRFCRASVKLKFYSIEPLVVSVLRMCVVVKFTTAHRNSSGLIFAEVVLRVHRSSFHLMRKYFDAYFCKLSPNQQIPVLCNSSHVRTKWQYIGSEDGNSQPRVGHLTTSRCL